MNLMFFPWDRGEKPFWVNPENGIEWWVDKDMTAHCSRDQGESPPLDAIVFYVCERNDGKVNPLTRILVDRKTNKPLAEHAAADSMCCKIDALRFLLKSEKQKSDKRKREKGK